MDTTKEIQSLTKRELYDRQIAMLDRFLASGAITKAQYDKSAGDLTRLMGFSDDRAQIKKEPASGREEKSEQK